MDELTIDNKAIGARIALRRKELKMTQETLTNIVDMSINQLSNIENNHSVPTLETIIKLSHALKVTPDYFLLGTIRSESQMPIEIAERAMLCTEEQQRLVYDFIDLLIKDNCWTMSSKPK